VRPIASGSDAAFESSGFVRRQARFLAFRIRTRDFDERERSCVTGKPPPS
jgi:hypothetical protein